MSLAEPTTWFCDERSADATQVNPSHEQVS